MTAHFPALGLILLFPALGFLFNLFLGWTIIVWGLCLWWAIAYTGEHEGAANQATGSNELVENGGSTTP